MVMSKKIELKRAGYRNVLGREMELLNLYIDWDYLQELLDKRQGIRVVIPFMIKIEPTEHK